MWIIFIVAAILLLFIILGLAYSFYNYTIYGKKEQPVQPIPDDILFHYSDVNGNGSGIFLENAKEMIDDVGKKLTGSGNCFSFTVSGNLGGASGKYTIVLEEDKTSTISSSDVKIYLTRMQGSFEKAIFDEVPTYSELENFHVQEKTYKKLYSVTFDKTEKEFSHDYVLRMWIRNGATDYYRKNYSLKVNVLAEGTSE